jgi:GxxExxY protein
MTPQRDGPMLEEALTRSVIGVFHDIHRTLGFGFREYTYALALERDLVAKGHLVEREVAVTVHYRGILLAQQSLDMIVDEKLVLEIKASERLHADATTQLFSYLCATNLEAGLLLHFGREAKVYRVIYENRLKRHQFASSKASSP